MTVTTRYFGAARAVTGVNQEQLVFPEGCTLGLLLAVISERYGPELGRLLDRCTFFVDGSLVRERSTSLSAGSQIDVLPPFAGG